jgi:hypothetical protein
MNARGNVIDAYRKVEVAADALEADLNVRLEAELGTDPDRSNPVRFDASASRYRAELEFDSPLNRFAERNAYRRRQIEYQQARRAYMALKDTIVADIRREIRQVEFDEFSFQIAKLQLLTAARQLNEAQLILRTSTDQTSSSTRNLLEALDRLLASKNGLIASYVSYEASRMALYRDLEQMQIAPDGTWINEPTDQPIDADDASGTQDGSGALEPFDSETGQLDIDEFEREFLDDPTGTEVRDPLTDEPVTDEPGAIEFGDGAPGDGLLFEDPPLDNGGADPIESLPAPPR